MGDIGKTTLAKAVYDCIKWRFEGCSFIDDVTEALNKGGVSALQEHLISDIFGEEDIKVLSSMCGLSIIESNVCRIKVLIVLDNVSMPKQVEIWPESYNISVMEVELLSLRPMGIVIRFEEEFGINVEEESAQTIAMVQDAADLIEKAHRKELKPSFIC